MLKNSIHRYSCKSGRICWGETEINKIKLDKLCEKGKIP